MTNSKNVLLLISKYEDKNMKYGIFEEKYSTIRQSKTAFTRLQIVKILNNNMFEYKNGKNYGLNTEVSKGRKTIGYKLNTYFMDITVFDQKIDGKVYSLEPSSTIYVDNETILKSYLTEAEIEESKNNFPFMFEDVEPTQQQIEQCQEYLNQVAEKGYKPKEDTEEEFYGVYRPNFCIRIDYGEKDREK